MSKPRLLVSLTVLLACPSVFSPVVARQASAPAALTLSIKGSTAYATPAPAQLQTALLIVTPVWEDINMVTQVGSKEASGQPLFVSELAVVLAGRAMDCTTIFSAAPPAGDQEVLVVAGKAEAYLPAKGWQTTSVGKVFTSQDESQKTIQLPIDRFSVDVQGAGLKKKFSKDNVRGNDGRFVLTQDAGNWKVDFAVKSGDVTAEGQVALTACPITSRKKPNQPLLSENRLLAVARSF